MSETDRSARVGRTNGDKTDTNLTVGVVERQLSIIDGGAFNLMWGCDRGEFEVEP